MCCAVARVTKPGGVSVIRVILQEHRTTTYPSGLRNIPSLQGFMPAPAYRYFAINKPYGMLSQFVGGHPGLHMLGDLPFAFPEGTHAIGRLDYTSEGLLLLTTNKAVTNILFN